MRIEGTFLIAPVAETAPRLAKLASSISLRVDQPIQDVVDLSHEVVRVLKDERSLAAESPLPGDVK